MGLDAKTKLLATSHKKDRKEEGSPEPLKILQMTMKIVG
jgi:hypothetical protein